MIGEALLDAAFTPKDDATTEDKVKRHPLYINLEKSLQEQAAQFEQEKEAAVSEVKNEFRRTQTRAQAVKLATDFFHSLKPILPSDTAKAQRQVELFLSSTLNGLEFDTDEAGNIVGLVKDGKRYEDAHGHAYDLNRVVKEAAASVYDFHQ